MRPTCFLPIALLLAGVIAAPAVAAGAFATGQASTPAAAPASAPGSAAPPASAPARPALQVTTLDGKPWDLASRRGHWVVVNFWATWCSPCLKEIPDLTALDARRTDLEVIGLAYEEISPEDMQRFLQEHPAGYPIAILDVYAPPADFDTPRGLPMTYLIGPEGQVVQRFLGPVTSQELEQAMTAPATAAR